MFLSSWASLLNRWCALPTQVILSNWASLLNPRCSPSPSQNSWSIHNLGVINLIEDVDNLWYKLSSSFKEFPIVEDTQGVSKIVSTLKRYEINMFLRVKRSQKLIEKVITEHINSLVSNILQIQTMSSQKLERNGVAYVSWVTEIGEVEFPSATDLSLSFQKSEITLDQLRSFVKIPRVPLCIATSK